MNLSPGAVWIRALLLAVLVWSAMHVRVADAQAVGEAGFESWQVGGNERSMVADLGVVGAKTSSSPFRS